MPTPPPVSRRTALGGAVLTVGLVTGCTAPGPDGSRTKPTGSREDPDVALLTSVLASERRLLDRVVSIAARHRDLSVAQSAAVAGARAAHRAHVDLLRAGEPSGSPSPSGSAGTTAAPAHVPGTPGSALLALARAEEEASRSHAQAATAARSGPFARVLASMAAASAQQAVHLRGAAGDRR